MLKIALVNVPLLQRWFSHWSSLPKRVRLLLQFVALMVLLFCHETNSGGLFHSKQILQGDQIKKIYSKKGISFEAKRVEHLVKLEMAMTFRAWPMQQPLHLVEIGQPGNSISILSLDNQHLAFQIRNPQGELREGRSDTGFGPDSRFQVLLEMDTETHAHVMTFYNKEAIDVALLDRHILKRYAMGTASLPDAPADYSVVKFKRPAKQHHIKLTWIKLLSQNPGQRLLEIIYYLLWTGFFLQLLWPIGKRIGSALQGMQFTQVGETRFNNVVTFALLMQGYLLFSLFLIYLIPQHKFGELPGFLYLARDRFSDFIDVVTYSASRNPYVNEFNWDGPIYYPFMMLLLKPLVLFHKADLIWGLLMFVVGSSWYAAHAFAPQPGPEADKRGWWLFLITMTSYPLLFGFDRGNVDLIILFFVILYLVSLNQGRSILAGTWLGFAIAAKVFPGLFVLIALRKRDFKAVVTAGVVTLVVSLVSMEIFGGDYAKSYEHFSFFYKRFEDVYLINSLVNFNHFSDPFSLLKSLSSLGWLPMTSETLYRYYSKFALLFILLISYIVFFKKEPLYIQLALIGVGVVVFPGLAYDYRLVFLFPALYVFFNRQENHPRDKAFWVFLFVILIPKHFGLIEGKWFLTCFVNPLWLLGFLAYCSLPHETWVRWMQRLAPSQAIAPKAG